MNKKRSIDDKDVVFIDEPWTEEERAKFSAYLKARKVKPAKQQSRGSVSRNKKHYA